MSIYCCSTNIVTKNAMEVCQWHHSNVHCTLHFIRVPQRQHHFQNTIPLLTRRRNIVAGWKSLSENTHAAGHEFVKLKAEFWRLTQYSMISSKAVMNVATTYHVLANLHFPRTLRIHHLNNTLPWLARHVTDNEYRKGFNICVWQRIYLYNGVRLHMY